MTGGYSQSARVLAATAQQFTPWSSDAEDRAARAWIAVQRITPEVARQERRAIDEMIEHLQEAINAAR